MADWQAQFLHEMTDEPCCRFLRRLREIPVLHAGIIFQAVAVGIVAAHLDADAVAVPRLRMFLPVGTGSRADLPGDGVMVTDLVDRAVPVNDVMRSVTAIRQMNYILIIFL